MFDFLKAGIVPSCPIVNGSPQCGWTEFNQLIENVMSFLLTVSIPLAIVVIIYGGFLFMTSGGSEQRITKGKQAMLSAIIGLAIVFGSYIIITTVIRALSN